MISGYARWIIRYKWLIVLASIVVVFAMAAGARNLVFTNDYRVFFSKENPQLQAFENLQDTYSKNDNIMVVLVPEDGNVFTEANLKAVLWWTEQAWQTPFSTRDRLDHQFSAYPRRGR